MSDVLPPSSLGSHSFLMSAVKRFCSALSFRRRVLQTFTACGPSVTDLDGCKQTLPAMASGGGGGGGSSGGLDQLLGAINTLLPALHPLFPAPSDHGGGHRTRIIRRAARWLASCLSFEVLYISVYANSILMLKNVTGYNTFARLADLVMIILSYNYHQPSLPSKIPCIS